MFTRMSQPSLAAWIEICTPFDIAVAIGTSQPSLAAWIEILTVTAIRVMLYVAALFGCVD